MESFYLLYLYFEFKQSYNKMQLSEINERYGIEGVLTFYEEKHSIVAEINSSYSKAKISLYGAQVLSFIPIGQEDLLFVSSESYFEEGKAIRGGIPICWPWFNAHPTEASFPSHGFARISTWQVNGAMQNNGEITLELVLKSNEETFKLFPYEFELYAEIKVGTKLSVALTTINKSESAFDISSALHSYFNVSDIANVSLKGLKDTPYMDDVLKKEARQNEDLLLFNNRIDRRYHGIETDCVINDISRRINVAKKGSKVTVVWNPWEELAAQMADLGNEDYRNMLCVEAANSLEDTITIVPGNSHCLETTISLI